MQREEGMDHHIDPDGVLHVVFDRPADRVNLLTPAILRELDQILARLKGQNDARAVVFES